MYSPLPSWELGVKMPISLPPSGRGNPGPQAATLSITISEFQKVQLKGMVGATSETFEKTIMENAAAFGLEIGSAAVELLGRYRSEVAEANGLLHLVSPKTLDDFAQRHVLESLALLKHLPHGSSLIDVGPGAGLPSIPCIIVREDITAVLVEAKEKKARFLRDMSVRCGLEGRVTVINRQFEEIERPAGDFVTCRALDKFMEKLPRLIRWSKGSKMLLFGGPSMGESLTGKRIDFKSELMPLSEQRYLFICR
jgi:16S rRNA (guanine(527)-N(7))-methyltransferase RsmG